MNEPVYMPLQSTGETIVLTLIELSTYEEIGGSPIDSYLVEMSVGSSGVWTTLKGDSGDFSLSVELAVEALTTGETYHFRSKAHNQHGWGEMSNELTVLSSGVPEQPAAAIVTIVNRNV